MAGPEGLFCIRQRTQPPKACPRRHISTKHGERCVPQRFIPPPPPCRCRRCPITRSLCACGPSKPTEAERGHPLFAPSPTDSLTGPKEGWTPHSNGPRMRSGTLPNGEPHSFYFPEDHPSMPGWFKGMEVIVSGSVVCGPREETFSPSVLLAAPLTALTAVAGVFSFCSQISSLKSPSFKS